MENRYNFMEKVENSENEVGRAIRRIRLTRKMSADALAKQGGLKKSALLHYENGIRSVSEESLASISDALDVPTTTLRPRHIESVADAMQVLFQLEQIFGIKPNSEDDKIVFVSDSPDLATGIAAWQSQYEKLIAGEITEEEYQDWKDRFPLQYGTQSSEQVAKVQRRSAENPELEALAHKDARYRRNGILRMRTHAMRALTGRNGSYVTQDLQQRICQFVRCSERYLNDETIVSFMPLDSRSENNSQENEVLIEILNILDKNADTEHFRIIQIQLSRIVLYYLKQRGFDHDALRLKEFISDQIDYLYTGKKAKQHGVYVGFDFTQLTLLREVTGMSLHEMFTGINR